MIQSLSIKNYALIGHLDIDFHRGFSVITGETGAGKSILIGAIGLLLGQRAETRMIKAGESRCVIEAVFDLTGYGMDDFFAHHDLDFDGHTCIIRRELTAAGKSRAFINDTPAQVNQLRDLGNRLIDIHSQHQNLLLTTEDFQLSVIDTLAHDEALLKAYTQAFNNYQQACRQLEEAQQRLAHLHDDEEYLRFQLQQLDELELQEGRQEEMEQEARMLEHAEEIRSALWTATNLIQGDGEMNGGVITALRETQHQLSTISTMLPSAEDLATRINSCLIELKDIEGELDTAADRVEVDPSRLDKVNEWLSAFYTALKKHHAADEAALIDVARQYREQLEQIDTSDEQLQALEQQREQALETVMNFGEKLTQIRHQYALEVEKQLHERLAPLGIPNVRFKVAISQTQTPTSTGFNKVDFLFSANKNTPLQPVADVASGGEIARVMLSLKAMLSGAVQLPTIIFDEIDTGVSGQIAERMALMMKEMGDGGRQVISITHLPQIAAIGAHHYRVFKQDEADSTTSHIEELDTEQRVIELAHMLSGAELTEAAKQNARALLQNV